VLDYSVEGVQICIRDLALDFRVDEFDDVLIIKQLVLDEGHCLLNLPVGLAINLIHLEVSASRFVSRVNNQYIGRAPLELVDLDHIPN